MPVNQALQQEPYNSLLLMECLAHRILLPLPYYHAMIILQWYVVITFLLYSVLYFYAPQINVSALPNFTEGGKPLNLFNNTLNLYDADSVNRSV